MNAEAESKPFVLITGAQGLIGRRLVKRLQGDYRIIGLDVAEGAGFKGDTYLQCDLTDDGSVQKSLEQIRNDCGSKLAGVAHLAAYYDFSGEPSPMYYQLTVQGTRRLVRRLQSFDVGRFLFSSSLLVMDPVDDADPLTEESATRAEWDYPQSKLAAEQVLKKERGEVPVAVLRIAGVYDEAGHSLPLSQHIRRIFERRLESYVFPGNVEHGQPFIHLDDLMDCFAAVLARRDTLPPYETFLVAEPTVLSHKDLQHRLGELIHGSAWPTVRIPKTVAKAGAWIEDALTKEEKFIKPWMIDLADDHYPVAIRHAREQLGWEPAHRLGEVLPAIVERLRRDPRGFYRDHDLPVPDNLDELHKEAEFATVTS